MERTIEIRKIGITKLDTDAIVNAANESLSAGGGVCGAIFKAAGYIELQEACNAIAHCPTGNAVLTKGFNLKSKYVIHAVGPVWKDGKHEEDKLLRSAYLSSLQLAEENECCSIGFPLISAGIFGYPSEAAWYVALSACADFLDNHKDCLLKIVFAVIDDEQLLLGLKTLRNCRASIYKVAEKDDWQTEEMPAEREVFILNRTFTDAQMISLRKGNIPQEMEDKWFWYMKENTLYAHRSWTGYCIYIIEFNDDGKNIVTVNRQQDQYSCSSLAEDEKRLNELLNWWIQPRYDYYNEWLSETLEAIKQTEMNKDYLKIGNHTYEAIFFHKPEEPYGWLSNWYPSDFVLDGMEYSSVEQYIMYQKCVLFGDDIAAKQVMNTADPSEQQLIARNASGYIDSVWKGYRQVIAERALHAKFSQNESLKEKLLETQDSWLVECARSDKNWACGIGLDDERRRDASNWLGLNILGFALMKVREDLKAIVR